MKIVPLLPRIVCYGALAFALSGVVGMWLVNSFGGCESFNEAAIKCPASWSQGLAEWSLMVFILTIFTGVPLLLALGGVLFAIVDLVRWVRRRQQAAS